MKLIKPNIMKYLLLFCYGLSIILNCHAVFGQNATDNPDNTPGGVNGNTINIVTSPELNNLTADWISGFEKISPGVKFSVNMDDGSVINKEGTIYILSADSKTSPSGWKMDIGRNVIVPVLNSKNPMFKETVDQGISTGEFASVFSGTEKLNWSDILKGGQNKPVNQYIIYDAGVMEGVSDFIQKDPAAINASRIAGAAEFMAAIQKDPYAIGFCRLSDIRRKGSNEIDPNISLLPIDKNGNGRMDNFENIYNSPDDLARGVWIGKYPHALAGNIYAMSLAKPTDKNAIAFLSWIMTDGGKYLVSNGYGDLITLEKQANLAVLSGNQGNEVRVQSPASLSWLLILVLVIVAILMVIGLTYLFTRHESIPGEEVLSPIPALNEGAVRSPKGLYYDKTHTWAFMEQDGFVRIGIDDFLLHITGTITRIKMKEAGEYVRRGEKILTLTKFGKQLSLYSPVSGIIKAQNAKLHENSSLVNNYPYAEGWVYLVEPKNWQRELQFMWLGEKHREWLKDELTRLRKFFEDTLKVHHVDRDYLVLQDGGELRDNLLADMGPEVWEEFQRKFIDPSR
jgi:glycine cleavage system H lipoate-binding protein/ABC-type phosphate transport system substrate-binding protein